MSRLFRAQNLRLVVPFCFLLLSLICYRSPFLKQLPSNAIPTGTTSEFGPQLESDLKAKAETVLRGFGEEKPAVVVTVVTREGHTEVVSVRLDPDSKLAKQSQETEEKMDSGSKGLESPGDLLAPEEKGEKYHKKCQNYVNTKRAVSWDYDRKSTTFSSDAPSAERISCLVQISERNAHRLPLIEKSLWAALSLSSERGDVVLAVQK